jgi:demethylmenaquinone methyltransferase/2-methoxy-6-polyprenyl-1,4-benzoquinol methylase
MTLETAMERYYAQRAPYYERVYHKPERQADLKKLREMVVATLAGKNVLEVACGTGYWTEIIAPTAKSIVAVDVNEEVLAVARSKPIESGKVRFLQGDAYNLPQVERSFDAAMVGFWWSHVPKARLHGFLQGLHQALKPGATVMVFDNAYVEGSSTPLSRKDSDGNPVCFRDSEGNTYQERVLDDGSVHQIVKNFPTEEEIRTTLRSMARDIDVTFMTYYWVLKYATLLP